MPRSARLKNIAGGLCGAFVSRNNDLYGYWALGKLRLLAEQHSRKTVLLDFLTQSMEPASPEFSTVLVRYSRLLEKLIKISRVRTEEITAASIVIDFAPAPWLRPRYIDPECGDQFVLTVTIEADGRMPGIVRRASYCRPHDPDKERRSTRCSDF